MTTIVRKTRATTLVIEHMLEIKGETWGLAISRKCELPPGTVYLILDRLVSFGWLKWRWDDSQIPGPRRKLYAVVESSRVEMESKLNGDREVTSESLFGKFPQAVSLTTR